MADGFAERFLGAYGAGEKEQRADTVRANAYNAVQGDPTARSAVYGADPAAGFNVDTHFNQMQEAQYKQHEIGLQRTREILYPLTQARPEDFATMLPQAQQAARDAGIPENVIATIKTPQDAQRAWVNFQTYEQGMAQKKFELDQRTAEAGIRETGAKTRLYDAQGNLAGAQASMWGNGGGSGYDVDPTGEVSPNIALPSPTPPGVTPSLPPGAPPPIGQRTPQPAAAAPPAAAPQPQGAAPAPEAPPPAPGTGAKWTPPPPLGQPGSPGTPGWVPRSVHDWALVRPDKDPTLRRLAEAYIATGGDRGVIQNELGSSSIRNPNFGRIKRVSNEITRQMNSQGLNGADLAANRIAWAGNTQAARSTGSYIGRLSTAIEELDGFGPALIQASAAVPRAEWRPANELIQMYNTQTGSWQQQQLGMYLQAFKGAYSVVVGKGESSVTALQRADELLSGLNNHQAIVASVRSAKHEAALAREAARRTMLDLRSQVPGASRQSESPGNTGFPAPPDQPEGGVAHPKTEEEYNALSPGAKYIRPGETEIRTKK